VLRCSGCKVEKPFDRFSKNKAHRTGYANWCKECMRKLYTSPINLARRTARRDASWEHSLVIECRSRARSLGLPFNLEKADIVVPDNCPVLGIPLFRTRGSRSDNSPSIDRVIPSLGYVKGNVHVISWMANRIKSTCDDPEVFENIAAYIRRSRTPKLVKSA
jgi:hypothetical protein